MNCVTRERGRARGKIWGIVLAGGEGTRLGGLTRLVYGKHVPKQFAALGSDRSFLQLTMDRIAAVVPSECTLVVVSQANATQAREQLAGYRGVQIVQQPSGRGTTAGILLPLAHVLHQDRRALVAVFPCDHRFGREEAFVQTVKRALFAVRGSSSGVVLVGAVPTSGAADLGWIVPSAADGPAALIGTVSRFVEKPPPEVSRALFLRGGLWNTLVLVARGAALWRTVTRQVPSVALAFKRYRRALGRPGAEEILQTIYTTLPASDISRDVLQKAPGLNVISMADSGWCDCGTPARLFQSLTPDELESLNRTLSRARRARAVHSRIHTRRTSSAPAH